MGRPRKAGINRKSYCHYLLSSQINYTNTYYAEHVETVSHDMVNRYLRRDKLTASTVWNYVKDTIEPHEEGFLVFDDTVLDKSHSREIEVANWQYSGNAHNVIQGIGLVNCIYINPETNNYWVIDYRIYNKDSDGKTKLEHVKDMLNNVVTYKQLPFKTVLMDTWYATNKLMLHIHDLNKYFYCPIRKNRMARTADTKEHYQKVCDFEWTEEELQFGKAIRLREMPEKLMTKLFRVPISDRRTDHVITNDPSQHCVNDTRHVCAMRWMIEQFHRELKQLTGVEQCQCRKQRIQRNHIACSMLVWFKLKSLAKEAKTTAYQIKHNLLNNYMGRQMKLNYFA